MKSIYNYILNYDGCKILYNTLTQSIVVLDDSEYLQFEKDTLSFDERQKLQQLGFIVPDGFNEKEVVKKTRCDKIETTKKVTFRILTTTKCNASCFYCYEKWQESETMSLDIAEKAAQFVINNTGDAKLLRLTWFGGEPLCNHQVITYITTRLKEALANIKYDVDIITNGYFLNQDLIDVLVDECMVSKIQITLDGYGNIHESRKKLPVGSFDRIINNIKILLSKNVKLSLRINFDENNYESVVELIEYLSNNVGARNNLNVYVANLFGSETDESIIRLKQNLDHMLLDYGFKKRLYRRPKYVQGRCFACDKNSFVISPSGMLFKCPQDMYSVSSAVGSIFSGVDRYVASYTKWCDSSVVDECDSCILLPLCQGGCRACEITNFKADKCNISVEDVNSFLIDQYNKMKER